MRISPLNHSFDGFEDGTTTRSRDRSYRSHLDVTDSRARHVGSVRFTNCSAAQDLDQSSAEKTKAPLSPEELGPLVGEGGLHN